jgi:hypothetical protein
VSSSAVALAPPPATTNAEEHADWLELVALADADRRASIEDLVGALRTTSSMEDLAEERLVDRGSEQAQSIAESAMSLAEERSISMARRANYPFVFSGQTVTARPAAVRTTYAYLLTLSWFGEDAGPHGVNGASLFEDVAGEAARNYLGGTKTGAQVYNFGFPRRRTPARFRPALDDLCQKMGEGSGSRARPTASRQKDAKLDLVAWVPMPDTRTGKIIGFGQCATGRNWKAKVSELQADAWCKKWLRDQPPVYPIRLFFLPHRINGTEWDHHANDAGIIFDRCRLTAYAANLSQDLRAQVSEWTEYVLADRLGR